MKARHEIRIFFVMLCSQLILGGHYLFWIPMCSRSHKLGMMPLGLELARRGHNITVVSPYMSNKGMEGVTEIVNQSELEALMDNIPDDQLYDLGKGTHHIAMAYLEASFSNNKYALDLPAVQHLIQEQHVDVVVTLPIFASSVGYFLAHKKNASSVMISTIAFSTPNTNWDVGNVFNPSFMPLALTGYSQRMTFLQRFVNTLITVVDYVFIEFYSRPRTDKLLEDMFPNDLPIPKISTLAKNIALAINHGSPFLGDGLRPVVPKTIMASLMTCTPARTLPRSLREFAESAEHGVIFVSFGSNIKASKMPEFRRQMLLSVFSKLKQRVIWKWEVDMPDAPPNVLLSPWLPQPDLLGHPNVKLFITHGGAGSYQEAICHKTPIVGIPLALDQFINLNEAVKHGMGVVLGLNDLTEENLAEAVSEVLNNPVYEENVVKLNDLILDQPEHPLERAAWWMEYLLRHPHNEDMKSPALELWWFQYFLLDVLLAILLIIFLVVSMFRFMVCFCLARYKTKVQLKQE